ncbi:MAG TPA: glutathione-disulfide reductase [Legionellales bacterium]|nr:glutathione-disulfide reductase [Legionellales bacterium]|tara:strand:- start:1102 stop:2457 length:1356 start_codon:yes stop_codon:yes gene_type:complete
MTDSSFDLIVLGGGSGGLATATRAAKHGAKVALIEAQHLGGTCVNVGCVPKKIMYNAALLAEMMQKLPDYGFNQPNTTLNWPYLIQQRQAYIQKLHTIYINRLHAHHITHIQGWGRFVDAQCVEVNGQTYQAPHIVIATGGHSHALPSLKGHEHVIDSDGFFALKTQPKKVAIIGSGYIGVELAGILHHLGTKTHLLLRGARPLSHFDAFLGESLLSVMQQQGIQVHTHHQAASIHKNAQHLTLSCTNGRVLDELDAVILAIGRRPNTQNLNLATTGIMPDENGFIPVDAFQQTAIPSIYALGDVTTAPALTPVAIAAGRALSDRLFGRRTQACIKLDNVASVIFSHPPIGTIGLTEKAAIAQYGLENIVVYQTKFNAMFEALSDEKTPTIMKLITLKPSEKILGLHVMGSGADELLQGFSVAINMGACKKDFDETIAIHPTTAEELVTLV